MSRKMITTAILLAVILCGHTVSSMQAAEVQAPEPRSRTEVQAVLAKAPKRPAKQELRQLDVVLVAFNKDHGLNEHDYPLWLDIRRPVLSHPAAAWNGMGRRRIPLSF